jgi:hypothetical protein
LQKVHFGKAGTASGLRDAPRAGEVTCQRGADRPGPDVFVSQRLLLSEPPVLKTTPPLSCSVAISTQCHSAANTTLLAGSSAPQTGHHSESWVSLRVIQGDHETRNALRRPVLQLSAPDPQHRRLDRPQPSHRKEASVFAKPFSRRNTGFVWLSDTANLVCRFGRSSFRVG